MRSSNLYPIRLRAYFDLGVNIKFESETSLKLSKDIITLLLLYQVYSIHSDSDNNQICNKKTKMSYLKILLHQNNLNIKTKINIFFQNLKEIYWEKHNNFMVISDFESSI